MQLYWSPKHLTSTVLMFKVKYEIFSNSVFICCSVLSSILTVLLFSEMNLYFGLRSFKLRKYAKCKIKSCFYIHLTHFKLSCGVPYILLPTSIYNTPSVPIKVTDFTCARKNKVVDSINISLNFNSIDTF